MKDNKQHRGEGRHSVSSAYDASVSLRYPLSMSVFLQTCHCPCLRVYYLDELTVFVWISQHPQSCITTRSLELLSNIRLCSTDCDDLLKCRYRMCFFTYKFPNPDSLAPKSHFHLLVSAHDSNFAIHALTYDVSICRVRSRVESVNRGYQRHTGGRPFSFSSTMSIQFLYHQI